MLDNNTEFFKPSRLFRSLSILEAVYKDSGITQKALARKTYMSEALVNQYIKDLETRGLIELKSLNKKQFLYSLTSQGQELRANLQDQYCSEMVQFLNRLKQRIRDSLCELMQNEFCSVAIMGAVEECEMVLSILRQETKANIMALVDQDPQRQGQNLHGHIVTPPEMLQYIEFDYIVIASFNGQGLTEEIRRHIPGSKEFKTIKI